MSDKQKTWLSTGTQVWEDAGTGDAEDDELVCDCWPDREEAASVWVRVVAQQIADDHNRIPELEQRAERAEAALRELVGSIELVSRRWFLEHHTATYENGLLNLAEALEQARAALPGGQEDA